MFAYLINLISTHHLIESEKGKLLAALEILHIPLELHTKYQTMTISNLTLAAVLICFLIFVQPFGISGFDIKLIPINGFDTTLFPLNLSLEEKYYRIFEISRIHVHQLEFAASLSSVG